MNAVYRATPAEDILFIGYTADTGAGTLAGFRDGALAGIRDRARKDGLTVSDVDPGAGGGQGVCLTVPVAGVPAPVPECAWVTDDSSGLSIPIPYPVGANTPPPSVNELADLMRRMRPDLELSCTPANVHAGCQ
jgi:hypothetical protein